MDMFRVTTEAANTAAVDQVWWLHFILSDLKLICFYICERIDDIPQAMWDDVKIIQEICTGFGKTVL
jgi:hypothetical protein